MKAHIPNSAFLGNINAFTKHLRLGDNSILEITANPKWISIHPLVLSMIAALGANVESQNIYCEEITASSGHYLVRMGLFDALGIRPTVRKKIKEHEPSGLLIPLRYIRSQDDLENFIKDLTPMLHQENPKHAEAIQHIFSELIRNVLEHSKSEFGAAVCAQYFKSSNRISIGVADTGVGLRSSLRRSYAIADDTMALKLALTPGITGTTVRPGGSAQNAGFGLFLIKSIAFVNANHFTILSGKKMYKLRKPTAQKLLRLNGDPFKDRHSLFDIPNWPGVAVGVDISLDQTRDFSELLAMVHRFYTKDVAEQKRGKYKKAKFI